MVLIYQVLAIECLKKVFLISNDFVPNGSSLLKINCEETEREKPKIQLFWNLNKL